MHAPDSCEKGIVTVSTRWVPRSGAGVPMSMEDDTAIAAAFHVVCAAAGVARSASGFLQVIHRARIVLTERGRECGASAHPEPARFESDTCAWDGLFHPTDGPRNQEGRSKGPCGVHV